MKKPKLGDLLKNRTRSYSAQAALTSLGVHLLIALLAGSIVAVRYVQRQNAELVARTEARPKLERKKIQAVARVEQVQKKAVTSKLTSKKVSFANPEFALPDTGRIASLKPQKLNLPGADAGRVLKNLAHLSGIGPARINFFGLRAESEKVVLVIDASSDMLSPRTGGPATYDYIKRELQRITAEMKPAMLFNLIFHDGSRVWMFRPELVPAAPETVAEVATWIQSVNSNLPSGGLRPEQHNYQPPVVYETAVGTDAVGWLLALQAALEQQPDTVLMLGTGWGRLRVSAEKADRMRELALWEVLTQNNLVSGAAALSEDRKQMEELLRGAITAMKQEERQRASKKAASGFIRDISQYIEYSKSQVMDHVETVYKQAYQAYRLSRPEIQFVTLTANDSRPAAADATRNLSALMVRYKGAVSQFRRDGLAADSQAASVESGESVAVAAADSTNAPAASFFAMPVAGSRVAFVLEASPALLSEANGGAPVGSLIKEQLLAGVAGLPEGTEFNVIAHDGRQVALFRPAPVPAGSNTLETLRAWLNPLLCDASKGLPGGQAAAVQVKNYPTVVGSDASGWLLAAQLAMSQQVDSIFCVGSSWGGFPLSRPKARQLLDFTIWEAWSSPETTVETADGQEVDVQPTRAVSSALSVDANLPADKRQRDALLKSAFQAISKEDQARKAKGLPPAFVRDILSYIAYTPAQLSEHVAAVAQAEYSSAKPALNFVCVLPAKSAPTEMPRHISGLAEESGGSALLFRGAATPDEMIRLNPALQAPAE